MKVPLELSQIRMTPRIIKNITINTIHERWYLLSSLRNPSFEALLLILPGRH
jgi:hypothetical protein